MLIRAITAILACVMTSACAYTGQLEEASLQAQKEAQKLSAAKLRSGAEYQCRTARAEALRLAYPTEEVYDAQQKWCEAWRN